MYKFSIILLILFITVLGISQTPFPENGVAYQDDIVPRIDIILHPDSLDFILAKENRLSDHYFDAKFIFRNDKTIDTIYNIGFRLRGNTSRSSAKKSFKISFNTFESGRKYHGLEKLNLNGEHNDPSIVRTKFCVDLAVQAEIISPRANHIKLFINNNYFGLYINVEHIDENFIKTRFGHNDGNLYKCLYPASLNYLGSDPDSYKEEQNGKRIYDLKNNQDTDDYSDLAYFISILNQSSHSDFRCELEQVFNVDSYIKNIAFDVLTANWDGYIFNQNNFYLYHNPETGKFEYILYDVDNTLGIDWFRIDWAKRDIYEWSPSNQKRPLYERIMGDPVYRSKYTATIKHIIDSLFIPKSLSIYLDDKKDLITQAALLDQYRTLDYGFSFEEFLLSFDASIDYNHTSVGIKEYISRRYFWALIQIQPEQILSDIESCNIVYKNGDEQFQFQVVVKNPSSLENIMIKYQFDELKHLITEPLNDEGILGDEIANDGIYSSPFISILDYQKIKYWVTFSTDKESYNYPTCSMLTHHFSSSNPTIAINEFMASNTTIIVDEHGEYDDWIELYNYGLDSVFLGDKYLSDKDDQATKWALPSIWIQADEYILFWADKDNEQGENHCNFKLSASGEYIGLFNADITHNEILDEYYFGEQVTDISEGRKPNGTGDFQSLNPTPGYSNIPTSTQEKVKLPAFILSPNPCSDYISITSYKDNIEKINIKLLDNKGQSIPFNYIVKVDRIDINTSDLLAGIYFIVMDEGEHYSTEKFVKIN